MGNQDVQHSGRTRNGGSSSDLSTDPRSSGTTVLADSSSAVHGNRSSILDQMRRNTHRVPVEHHHRDPNSTTPAQDPTARSAPINSNRAAFLEEMRHSNPRPSTEVHHLATRTAPTEAREEIAPSHLRPSQGAESPASAAKTWSQKSWTEKWSENFSQMGSLVSSFWNSAASAISSAPSKLSAVVTSARETIDHARNNLRQFGAEASVNWSKNFSKMGTMLASAWDATSSFVTSIPSKVSSAASWTWNAATSIAEGLPSKLSAAASWVGETAVWLGGKAVDLAVKAADPQNWINLGKALLDPQTYISIKDSVVSAVQTGFEWGKKAYFATGEALYSAGTFLAKPEMWTAVKDGLVSAFTTCKDFAVNCLTDPKKALEMAWTATKAVGHFLYDMGKTLGVNDMLWGSVKFVEGCARMATAPFQFGASLVVNSYNLLVGNQDFNTFSTNLGQSFSDTFGKAAGCFVESATAVKGAVMLIGELTGVTDAVKCVYYLAKGDLSNAALHGAFALMSAGAIAATVATGGAAVGSVAAVAAGRKTVIEALKQFGKVALTNFAKEAAETVGKDTGKTIVKKMTAELGEKLEQAIVKTTENVVEKTTSQLAKLVEKTGKEALTGPAALHNFERLVHETALPEVHKLLKELNVFDRVKSETLELLRTTNSSSISEVADRLTKLGMSPEAARTAAKDLKVALRRGLSDDELAQVLAHQISEEISGEIIKHAEKPFKEMMARALRGELDTAAGRELAQAMEKRGIKLTEKEIDDLTEAGWKGYKRAIKEATEEVCLKAVREAIKEFRKHRHLPDLHRKPFEVETTTFASTPTLASASIHVGDRYEFQKEAALRPDDPGLRKVTVRSKTTILTENTEESDLTTVA